MEGLKIDEIIAQIPSAPGTPPAGQSAPPAAETPGGLKPAFEYGEAFDKAYPKK
jgi:ribosomal protein L12E/L44/L45/RPP1/RPP2